ncbi:tail fiber protein [Fulvivirga maritima]|uniref:tail fiber protein n=1 Tax=Fulvivirga maritima TaxID=2904247 RepID=UPI001F2A2949|nr:tail fiber protein [Fulvivirga maritima]UII24682.1 tail fiber protein [Fulvivirga maritima]
MEINKKNRTELKNYFLAYKIPTEQHFKELIDASFNQMEDGIAKVPGSPIALEAEGDAAGLQEVLNLFNNFEDNNPSWGINLNPRVDQDEPSSNKPGLNFSDASGQSKLFLRSGDGNIGIGTIEPAARLTIKGKSSGPFIAAFPEDSGKSVFVVAHEGGGGVLTLKKDDGTAFFSVKSDKVQVKTALEAANFSPKVDLDADKASDQRISTQKAVKTYVDNRLPKGVICMWSGQQAPAGWALCDGQNGTPNLTGKFVVGFGGSGDYKAIGNKGGAEHVTLSEAQMPKHDHSGTTGAAGKHTHRISHKASKNTTGDSLNTYAMDGENHGTRHLNTDEASNHTHSFTTQKAGDNQPHENRPPYYVLAYIIKL